MSSVSAFHKTDDDPAQEREEDVEDILFSLKPPATDPFSDPQYLETIWKWIIEHPDVRVKHVQDDSTGTEPDQQRSTTTTSPPAHAISFCISHEHQRLYTTDDRIWKALTDHGVDRKKVPALEFVCLSLIARAGPPGMLQPDLVKLSGQDKRSVPKRTDSLQAKGYIVKEACLGGGVKTSLLRLKKFVHNGKDSTHLQVRATTIQPSRGRRVGDDSTWSMIRYDQWFDDVVNLLKQHNNIMAWVDMRKELVRIASSITTARH